MKEKLHSQSGETLVELLASILIAALSVAMLFCAVMTAVRMDETALLADETYYGALTKAEKQEEAAADLTAVSVTVTGGGATAAPAVTFYGEEGLYTYAVTPMEETP